MRCPKNPHPPGVKEDRDSLREHGSLGYHPYLGSRFWQTHLEYYKHNCP